MGLFGKKKPQPTAAAAPVMPVAPVQHVPHWDHARFKIQLRMARTRIEVQRTKRENSIISNRRTAADHLRNGKDELARIFAEKTLRERSQMEAYDVVMTYVELLIENAQFIGNIQGFDNAMPDVKESVASLVYATQRMSVAELRIAADMLRTHFGAATIDPIASGDEGPYLHCVNRLLSIKLDSTSPDSALVREELIRIAADNKLDWTAPPDTFGSVQPPYNPNPFYPPPPNAPPPTDFGGGYGGGGYGGGGYGGGGGGGYNTAAPVNPASIPGMGPPSQAPYAPPQAPPAFAPPAYAPNAPIYPTYPSDAPPPSGSREVSSTDDFMTRLNNLKNS